MNSSHNDFYIIFKLLLKIGLTSKQNDMLLNIYTLWNKASLETLISKFIEYNTHKIKQGSIKQKLVFELFEKIDNQFNLKCFSFILELNFIKNLLIEEAKMTQKIFIDKLKVIHPLSLEYQKTIDYFHSSPRIYGILPIMSYEKLETIETNFLSIHSDKYIKKFSRTAIELKKQGVESNQIFMLMFSESINQSIISDSGSNYEDRIFSVLTNIGINANEIQKTHDKNDSSTEFDFFFELEGKSYGIGAKKTLRERYKQFIKTAQMSDIDVMIEITLGIDLTKEKVKAIRNHCVYLFIADEVYQNEKYLQQTNGVYSVEDLSIQLLISL